VKHSEILKIITQNQGKQPTQPDIATILEKPVGTIKSRASKDLNYSVEEVKKLSEFYNINLFENNLENIKQNPINKRIDYFDKKEEFVADYYPDVFGSCGSGTFVLSETKELINVPKKIVKSYSKIKKYSVINAYGDSMMPFIHDKDLLIVQHYENEQIKDNRIYVFRFDDNIFVKRLVLNINQLVIKSDNKDYQPITIELDKNTDIQIIGQIVGLMRDIV